MAYKHFICTFCARYFRGIYWPTSSSWSVH